MSVEGQTPPRIAVVGGGIAGLAAAHRLGELSRQTGRPVDVRLFEAGPRLGGWISTERTDGFVLEGGPDSFISEKPWALALCERLGFTHRLVRTREENRRTYVVHDGRLHALPDGFLLLAPTRFWPLMTTRLFSWPGKLRMGLDLVLPRGEEREDESLGSFVRRRLGREALERVAQPLVGGIYTADPDELSLRATFPRFLEMERRERSLIAAMWRQMRRAPVAGRSDSGARWSLFVSVDDGLQSLVDAIVARLSPESIHLGRGLAQLRREQRWTLDLEDGERVEADGVILATSAPRAASCLADLDPGLARELREIPYASSATVTLAFRENQLPRPLDGFGFVVPMVEARSILAATYSSLKYPGRAPKGYVLLRVFVGGALQAQNATLDDETLVRNVRAELSQLLGIEGEPVLVRIRRYAQAMPQYRVGHLRRVDEIARGASVHPALALCGNAYRGVGIPDCIHSGEGAAERVWEQVTGTPSSSASA